MKEGPFAAQVGNSGVEQNSREILINMYAQAETSGRSKLIRRQRPGINIVYAFLGLKRGIEEFTHGHYLVVRNIAYKFDGTTLTVLGVLNTSIGAVTIITDENENVLFSDNVDGYHWDGSTFTVITAPSDVGTLAFQGGFGIYAEPNTDRWYKSALNDLTSWDALDFATAESNPDKILRVFVDHGEVWFFGAKTIEIWRNAGAQDFPYIPNTQMERGCAAAMSIAADDNTLFWLADDGMVYRADGYRPQRISTHAIEDMILGAPDQSAARAFVYTIRGHKFYTLTFPGYATLQYNIATGFWNTAKTWDQEDWQIIGGAGKAVSYYLTPAGIVTLDHTRNTDGDLPMERGGISAPVWLGGERFSITAFWLDAEVGRVAEGASEPQVMLQVARNGEDFGNVRVRGLGETGDFIRRAVWRGLGQARQFVLKLTTTDDFDFVIITTQGDVQ